MFLLYVCNILIAITYQYYANIRNFEFVTANTLLYSLYAVPNFVWYCVYVAVYALGIVAFSLLYGDFSDPVFNS